MTVDLQNIMQALQHATLTQAEGYTSARITPSLRGWDNFEANHFHYDGTLPALVTAHEVTESGDALGVAFRLFDAGEGQPAVANAFGSVNNGLYLGHDLIVKNLQWRPGDLLSFDFSFSFRLSDQVHQFSDGHFELRY